MNPIASIVVKAGILPEEITAEFRKWGLPIPEDSGPPLTSAEAVVGAIEQAMQSEGYVLTRETDLEVLGQYLNTQKVGSMHLVAEDPEGDQEAEFQCTYGMTPLGEYIIPNRGESFVEFMTNGKTYLQTTEHRIFFADARDLFYGDNKAFIICVPSVKELLT
jgi:hypothetical protein